LHISSSSSSDEADVDLPARSAVQECYVDIVEIIDRLYRLSIAIRSPSIRTATSKALSYIERDELGNDISLLFEQYTLQRIRFRYSQLEPRLAERVGKSISRRRRLFMYRRRHREKLQVVEEDLLRERGLTSRHIISNPNAIPQSEINESSLIQPSMPPATLNPRSIFSQTTATEYVAGVEITPEASSIAPTSVVSGVSMESDFCIPPIVSADEKDFECPYCFCILSGKHKKKKLWEYVTKLAVTSRC
jgi:hypothetical protein